MNQSPSKGRYLTAALGVLWALTITGCATRGYQQADKTGEAINTLRNDVVNMKYAVDHSMKALDQVVAAASTNPRKPYEDFAKSVDKVEAAGDTAKSDADTMRERGAAYFQQWQTELASVKNEDIRQLAQQRRAKLQQTFDKIKDAAQAAKQSFPAYLSDLKDLRTALGVDLTAQGIDATKDIFLKTKNSGVQVQKDLDKLITELNTVVAAVTAAKAPAPAAK
jgi:hypothetical protein